MWLLLLTLPARADQFVGGDALQIYFDTTGTWNDTSAGKGLQALHDGAWLDWTYAGYPYQVMGFGFHVATTADDVVEYANSNTASATCAVSDESDLSTADWAIARYTYDDGSAQVVQTESWGRSGRVMRVRYDVTAGARALDGFRLVFEVDPDPDAASGDYTTVNDVLDTDGDGAADLAVAVSPAKGYTLAFGACGAGAELGFNGSWSGSSDVDPDVALSDPDGAVSDSAMGIRLPGPDSIPAGASGQLGFVVIEADSLEAAEAAWLVTDACGACDADGDGHDTVWCGGDDCDDGDPLAYPGAPEVWYDGVDEDCAGDGDYDQDADGVMDPAGGGDDCDDTRADVHPGADDAPYDGVDADCDGASDYDADGDGYDSDDFGGEDCNDHDPAISPDATEIYYDDIDQDCDGNDDDADGDGYDSPLDCDDTAPGIYPGAPGVSGDGIDSDCDGSDDDVSDSVDIKGGCGCATAPSADAAWAAALLGAALLRRRRA